MRYGEAAVCIYGMVITDEVLELLVSKVNHDYDPDDYADAPYYFSAEVETELGITRLTGFTGEAFRVAPDARYEMAYDWEEILFVPCEREVSPFFAAYDSFEEMVAELSSRFRKLLPDDFDYTEYIRHIVGTCTE